MPASHNQNPWGTPPWQIDFTPPQRPLPPTADFAVIGAGFSGLAAAAWLRLLAPEKSVVVLEAGRIGRGASGRTGGMALEGAAADDLSGLEDVLGGLRKILERLEVECDLSLPGAWEIARRGGSKESPIAWNDSGTLRVVNEVPGGTLDPGKLVSGLARAGDRLGAIIAENHPVEHVKWGDEATIHFAGSRLRARKALFATNGLSLGLSGMHESTVPKLTLAALSSPLSEKQLEEIGLAQRKPFYTVDFPYLWGRVCNDNSLVLGAGLLDAPESCRSWRANREIVGGFPGAKIASREIGVPNSCKLNFQRTFGPRPESGRFSSSPPSCQITEYGSSWPGGQIWFRCIFGLASGLWKRYRYLGCTCTPDRWYAVRVTDSRE